jgi:hypothetical protein
VDEKHLSRGWACWIEVRIGSLIVVLAKDIVLIQDDLGMCKIKEYYEESSELKERKSYDIGWKLE